MSNIVKRKMQDSTAAWDTMMHDANGRIAKLQKSIRVFEKRKAAGEPCPALEVGKNQQQGISGTDGF